MHMGPQAALPPRVDIAHHHHYALHDGKVHNPLGAGSYIYKTEYISSYIRYLGLPLPTFGTVNYGASGYASGDASGDASLL